MTRSTPILCMAVVLSGCASLSYPLAKCDGYSRRPLNRALWQWEESSNLEQKSLDATQVSAPPVPAAYSAERTAQLTFAHLDIDGSHRPCEG